MDQWPLRGGAPLALKPNVDCTEMAALTMAEGVVMTLKPGEFDNMRLAVSDFLLVIPAGPLQGPSGAYFTVYTPPEARAPCSLATGWSSGTTIGIGTTISIRERGGAGKIRSWLGPIRTAVGQFGATTPTLGGGATWPINSTPGCPTASRLCLVAWRAITTERAEPAGARRICERRQACNGDIQLSNATRSKCGGN